MKPINDHAEPAMCCCPIPPCHDFRAAPRAADEDIRVSRIWASFAAGVVLLSMSLAGAVWLASRLA
jgi:hypothetical protein